MFNKLAIGVTTRHWMLVCLLIEYAQYRSIMMCMPYLNYSMVIKLIISVSTCHFKQISVMNIISLLHPKMYNYHVKYPNVLHLLHTLNDYLLQKGVYVDN